MKCLSLHSADIAQDQRWHWTYLWRKQIQSNILFTARISVQKNPSIKNVNTFSSFMNAFKKNIILHLQT